MKTLILIGARNSGKTQTIGKSRNKGLKGRFKHIKNGRLFSRHEKLILTYISSCQEQVKFCHVDDLVKCIEHRIEIAKKASADLLIQPFTVERNRAKQLNKDCIIEALKTLKSHGVAVTLVHIQRTDAAGASDIDAFVKSLDPDAVVIKSEKNYEKQADRLLEVVDKLLR